MSFWQSINIYKKVKRELISEISDASWSGASISIATVCIILWLVYSELMNFLDVTIKSKVLVEHPRSSNEDMLQVVFNVDFPKLKCEYCTIQATNFQGTHSAGLATRVNKYHLDKNGNLLGKYVPAKAAPKHETLAEALDIDGGAGGANATTDVVTLTAANFDFVYKTKAALLVAFCVPSNLWCQRLGPVWDKAAAELSKLYGSDGAFVVGRVNCDDDEAQPVCAIFELDSYPSILVVRRGEKGAVEHETYHGERSVASLVKWGQHIIAQGKAHIPKTRRVDADRDGVLDSHDGVGCRIMGIVHVQKSPGMIHFQASQEGKEFDYSKLDMTHHITHLSFGHSLTKTEEQALPTSISSAVSPLSGKGFKADQDAGPVTHEHYIKVVQHRVEVGPSWTINGHCYIAHSAQVQPPPTKAPMVTFSYDMLPFTVYIQREKETLFVFLTELCGIVGGVFTVAGLLAGILHRIQNLFQPTRGGMPL